MIGKVLDTLLGKRYYAIKLPNHMSYEKGDLIQGSFMFCDFVFPEGVAKVVEILDCPEEDSKLYLFLALFWRSLYRWGFALM